MAGIEKNDTSNTRYTKELFRQNHQFIRQAIHSKVKEPEIADEIFQELFVKLSIRKLPERIDNPRSFLYIAIAHLVRDLSEKERKYRQFLDKYRCAMYNEQTAETGEMLIREEQMRQVFDAIENKLPDRHADALRLRYHNQMDLPQIADSLGIKKRSVSRYLSAALMKLSRIMNTF